MPLLMIPLRTKEGRGNRGYSSWCNSRRSLSRVPPLWGCQSIAWYTLPDVRASLAYGQALRLRGPSVATWQLRLLIEAGLLEPYPVPARPLPPAVPPAVRRVYAGFVLLLGCKWCHTPQAPTPFAWRFAPAWCGVEAPQVGEAMQWLLAQRYLRHVGTHGGTALFFPGRL